MIHSSAVVDSHAQLESDVEIGPNVVIEGPVSIGAGTKVQANAVIVGQVKIGSGNFCAFCRPGGSSTPQIAPVA